MNQIKVWAEKNINRRGHGGFRRGTLSLPPRPLREPQCPPRLEVCHSLRAALIVLVAATAIAAQQIGNPTTQQGVTGLRGVYVIRSAHIGVTRVDGVTSVVSMPQGGIISGQAALINLNGTSPREMAVVTSVALVIDFPRVTRFGGDREFSTETQGNQNLTEALNAANRQIEELRKMLRDAESYGRAQDAYARDPKLPRPDQNVVLASLVPFARGEKPVIMRANREAEIRSAVHFADEMKLQAIILGGDDAAKVATLLKEKNVPVILTGTLSLPLREDDYYDALYETAAKLQSAGVRFCISTGNSGSAVRNLPLYAGMAAAFGLPKAEALKAVTLYPAQIMNVADRMGSIEPGKMANIVVTDGDLLEVRTHVRYLFINGARLPLTSRHTELYDAFKDRK